MQCLKGTVHEICNCTSLLEVLDSRPNRERRDQKVGDGRWKFFVFAVFSAENAVYWCFCAVKVVRNVSKVVRNDVKVVPKYAKVVQNCAIFCHREHRDSQRKMLWTPARGPG